MATYSVTIVGATGLSKAFGILGTGTLTLHPADEDATGCCFLHIDQGSGPLSGLANTCRYSFQRGGDATRICISNGGHQDGILLMRAGAECISRLPVHYISGFILIKKGFSTYEGFIGGHNPDACQP